MQRTKAELEGEVSALTESLEALRSVGGGICELAAKAATAAELEAAAHQVCPLSSCSLSNPFCFRLDEAVAIDPFGLRPVVKCLEASNI